MKISILILTLLLLSCSLDSNSEDTKEETYIVKDYFYPPPSWLLGSWTSESKAVNYVFITNTIKLNLPLAINIHIKHIDFQEKYNNNDYSIQVLFNTNTYIIRIISFEDIAKENILSYSFILKGDYLNYYSEIDKGTSGPNVLRKD